MVLGPTLNTLPARSTGSAPLAPESAINAMMGSPSDTPQSCRCEVLIEPRASPRRIEGGSVVLGPNLNRAARESNRLAPDSTTTASHVVGPWSSAALSGRCVLSTYRAEGLAATIRGRERGAWPYPKPPCPREQPTRAREHDDGVSRCGALVLRRTERTMRPKYLSSRGPRRDE